MRWQPLLIVVLLAIAQIGCAARSKAERAEKAAAKTHTPGSWLLRDYADYQTDDVDLRVENRVLTVAVPPLRVYAEVAEKIVAVGPGIHPIFLIVEGKSPNAFAVIQQGHFIVAINIGMIELLAEDPTMWAAVIGHELAHLALDHQRQRTARQETSDATKGILAFALAVVGIPFGMLATDTAVTANVRSHSRDEERAADALGVEYLRRSGFDAAGALRFQDKMATVSKSTGPQFLSTHPTWEDRIENLRQLIAPQQK